MKFATTLRFYTKLKSDDASKAVAQLPAPVAAPQAATPRVEQVASDEPKRAVAS